MDVLKSLVDSFKTDETRLRHYFLVDSLPTVYFILIFYVVFVRRIGPALMQNRNPWDLSVVIKIYNIFQLIWCSILVFLGTWEIAKIRANLFCFHQDTVGVEIILKLVYGYYILKWFDLLETIFFVLRKKNSQVSFLHVYHHVMMVLSSSLGCRYLPISQGTLMGLTNTWVHIPMYYYYLISTNTEKKNSIWWKKYLTLLQMIQHTISIVLFSSPFFNPDCPIPRSFMVLGVLQATIVLFLFAKFYVKTYLRRPNYSKIK